MKFKKKMRTVKKIIIHCSDTFNTMDIGVEEIRKWHMKRGFNDIGYHFVIRRDGTIETGRDINTIGAHCKGQNKDSIGICLVGGKAGHGDPADNFNECQVDSAKDLLEGLRQQYVELSFHGHNEFSNKACPVIDINRIIPS